MNHRKMDWNTVLSELCSAEPAESAEHKKRHDTCQTKCPLVCLVKHTTVKVSLIDCPRQCLQRSLSEADCSVEGEGADKVKNLELMR